MAQKFLINSISTETTRFVLIEDAGEWAAERREKTEDGGWLTAWATGNHVNQAGARIAIRNAFGL